VRLSGWRCRLANRSAMNSAHITYVPRPDTSPEAELSALCNVYKLIIDHANKNAAGMTSTNGGDEKERSRNVSLASNHSTT
jgi:hypothetical protein